MALAAALLTGGTAGGEAAGYRIQPGDVLEISLAGLPQLGARAAVQLDGSLAVPVAGELQVAGRGLAEVREAVRTALASRLLPVYGPDGRAGSRTVSRDQVGVWIAEYRPVFVSGDVARAGELAFRPGMTARQALAAAGGVAPEPMAVGGAPNPDALRADYAAAWHELAAAETRGWRLRAELGAGAAFDASVLPPPPADDAALEASLATEEELRATRSQDHERQRRFLERTLDQLDSQTEVLRRQLDVERQREEADAADLAKAESLRQRGVYTQSRLVEIRSAALISATRRLQTEAGLMQLERRRTEVAQELDRLDDARRMALLDDLQGARARQAAARARLDAVLARLRAAGIAPMPAGRGEPVLMLVRDGAAESEPAAPETPMQPGDVLMVSRAESQPASVRVGSLEPRGEALRRASLPGR
ncbi:MAG: polysaccharide biosynthesis/export family protein [Pseudomonadota bacterium]